MLATAGWIFFPLYAAGKAAQLACVRMEDRLHVDQECEQQA
jgi:hypothetical protein